MSAGNIAVALGGHREGRQWRCPCPVHGGRSLSLADGRDGALLVHCFGGCEWRDIFLVLRHRGLIGDRLDEISPEREVEFRCRRETSAKAEIERLARSIGASRDLYQRAREAAGTVVETYLRLRGIMGPIPGVLRFLEHCPHRSGKYHPAMLAPIVNVHGEQVAIHKTFLRPDGSGKADLPKAEQRETCGPMKGSTVRLAPPRPGVPLLVGEGNESTLSAMQLFGLPGWAALSADGIEALELPAEIREVAIAADNDVTLRG
jgi:putative DNA primase/helicase